MLLYLFSFNRDSLLYLDQEAKFSEVKRKAVVEAFQLMKKMSENEDALLLGSFQEKYIDDEIRNLRSKIVIQEGDSGKKSLYKYASNLHTCVFTC